MIDFEAGLAFENVSHCVLVWSCDFYVKQDGPHRRQRYWLFSGPEGMLLKTYKDKQWSEGRRITDKELEEEILPQTFGRKWTYRDFYTALVFFRKGNLAGRNECSNDGY